MSPLLQPLLCQGQRLLVHFITMQSIFLGASLKNHINCSLLVPVDRKSSFFIDNSVSAVKLITGYKLCPLLSCVLSLMDGSCSYPSKTTVVHAPYCRTVKSAYDSAIAS